MAAFDLKNFDSYREDNRLEVKAANGGLPGTLWETYSSFANTYGGCIICGVSQKKDGTWTTTKLKDIPKLRKDLWNTIHNKTKVSLCLITEPDRTILTLPLVPSSSLKLGTGGELNGEFGELNGELLSSALSEKELKIYNAIKNTPLASRQMLTNELKIAERTFDRTIKSLIEKGFITRIGPKKGGHWEINYPPPRLTLNQNSKSAGES